MLENKKKSCFVCTFIIWCYAAVVDRSVGLNEYRDIFRIEEQLSVVSEYSILLAN